MSAPAGERARGVRLDIEGVSVALGGHPVLDGVTVRVPPGSVTGLVGPNGSGKSTLLRTCYRALAPAAGAVLLDGRDVRRLSAREAAREAAVVLQEHPGDFAFTATEVVMMGRIPHKRPLDPDTPADRRIAAGALARVGAAHLAGRAFSTLSGGEKQRVLIARALAQQARVLLLDEPTNHLDVRAQLEIMQLVRGLGLTVLAAIHDLNLAAGFCDQLCLLAGGRVRAAGPPAEVLRPELIAEVLGVGAVLREHPVSGRPELSFYPLPAPGAGGPAGSTPPRRGCTPPWPSR